MAFGLGVLRHLLFYEELCGLKKPQKLVTGKTGLFEDCEKRTALERSAVEGNGNDTWAIRVSVVAVGAGEMIKRKPARSRARMTSVGVPAGRRLMRPRGSLGSAR